ncbi:2-dehydropantoate 2-reductase [Fictibacillus macauensis ZFHKF-1]|uniref:2-dehydropantoate 2-reductase n=1 Tax=Fictibacillus macauensis ZFHKF-1 TaxID=1196324 RepID=I8UDW6_9BACL|nr:2-dehydropantoate 2-reductase [Fictibacillus macauensis]EIT84983.1 2-dehydropantoate 2-reductase [Fictibacillus macauensis ZFHKF-1]
MKVAVIGGGAIGLLMASMLTEMGSNVTLYTRTEEQANAIMKRGVKCHYFGKNERYYPLHARKFPDLKEEADLVVICVKQHQLSSVLAFLKQSAMVRHAIPLFLQNGMGHLSSIEQLPQSVVMAGVVEHGALRISETDVQQTGKGALRLFFVKGNNQDVQRYLQHPILDAVFSENARHTMEEKLLANAVINPLTALFEVENGALLHNESLRTLALMLFEEARSVLNRSDREKDLAYLWNICEGTKRNRSSMLKDIENGTPTEIEAISGYLIKQAEAQNLPVPYTSFVYHAIKAKELVIP